jgi:hypothetical protein
LANVRFLWFALIEYLGDPQIRAKYPIPQGADPLKFVVQLQQRRVDLLRCPLDTKSPTGQSSYMTWDRENLLLLWDKRGAIKEDLPLIWEKEGNHGGKHWVHTFGGMELLSTAALDSRLAKARSALKRITSK